MFKGDENCAVKKGRRTLLFFGWVTRFSSQLSKVSNLVTRNSLAKLTWKGNDQKKLGCFETVITVKNGKGVEPLPFLVEAPRFSSQLSKAPLGLSPNRSTYCAALGVRFKSCHPKFPCEIKLERQRPKETRMLRNSSPDCFSVELRR